MTIAAASAVRRSHGTLLTSLISRYTYGLEAQVGILEHTMTVIGRARLNARQFKPSENRLLAVSRSVCFYVLCQIRYLQIQI